MPKTTQLKISAKQIEELLQILKSRFDKNKNRHPNIDWQKLEAKLRSAPDKMASLYAMEQTGGEPDVVHYDNKSGEYSFFDCSAESPNARRSLCYDQKAWESRKEHKPKSSALQMAAEMGVSLLNESQYEALQKLGSFDTKTSSWLSTPTEIRKLGGAIFGDWRYGRLFIYHNGAESYYAGRGWRAVLTL